MHYNNCSRYYILQANVNELFYHYSTVFIPIKDIFLPNLAPEK
jgi:hypothetical protein